MRKPTPASVVIRRERSSEFVHFLSGRADLVADLLTHHVRSRYGSCTGCTAPWPCNSYRLAEQALAWPLILARPRLWALKPVVVAGICRCQVAVAGPTRVPSWLPGRDGDPGSTVGAVAVYGASPEEQRFERIPMGEESGWSECGTRVTGPDPLLRWADVGRCWAATSHPVIAAQCDEEGTWSVSAGSLAAMFPTRVT